MVQLGRGHFTSHMVPVMDANENFVVLGDPLLGKCKVTVEKFLKRPKGRATVITPDNAAVNTDHFKPQMR